MAIHKLALDDFEEADYQLIALHTTLEDYRLAYFINQKLPILLHRNKKEIQTAFEHQKTAFSRFTFEDKENDIWWNLIENKKELAVPQKNKVQNLFNENQEFTTTLYFLPEFKKVDFFLKIESEEQQIDLSAITSQLKNIDTVTTVYHVTKNQIKSKNNLIF